MKFTVLERAVHQNMIGAALLWLLFFHRCFHLSSAYSEKSYEFSVIEESPKNTFIGRVALNNNEKYRISAPNPIIKDLFYIDFINGNIKTLNRIDRDNLNIYNNTIDLIIVSQSASLISIHIHILDINDNSPQFLQQFYNISIVESAITGSKFPLQTAKDPDYGMNGTIAAYRLKSDDPETLYLFKVHRVTDIIGGDAIFLELLNSLDREMRSSYTVEIEAVDGGQPSLTGSFILFITILDVNDNAPVFENPFLNVTIDSNGKENEIIAKMAAFDADIGLNSELSYALVDNVKGQFEIDSNTGEIKRKRKTLSCNKETCSHCLPNICVISTEVSDKGVPKLVGRSFLNVHLNQHKTTPLEINLKVYPSNNEYLLIDENVQIGSTLAVLTVNGNQNNKIELSLISGNDEKIFELEHGHGFAILRLNKKVDFKKEQKYLVTFEASDSNDTSKKAEKSLQVYVRNVNEKPPQFKEKRYISNINETTFVNNPVLKIKADSESSKIEYSIINETLVPFNINPKTGVIKLSEKLDYSFKTFYEFQVKATNPAPSWKISTVPVRINILDSNNNAPKFYEKITKIAIPENFDISKPIFQAKCLDMDYKKNAAIKYRILNSNEDSHIWITEENGKIYLKNELDFEKVQKFDFDVICENIVEPTLSDYLKVLIFVEDINDNFPYFEQHIYHANIYNGDTAGTEILKISAKDEDEHDKHNLTYFLINAPIGYIDVEKTTGKIFTLKIIDINTIGLSFNITIGAKDSEKHLSKNNAIIVVHIIDTFNIENLLFDSVPWIIKIEENATINYLIGKFTASALNNENIEYSLLKGDKYLDVNERNGELRTKNTLDYEEIKEIQFTILAKTDKSVNMKNGTIVVIDVNDNPPKFTNPKQFTVDISKLAIGESFGKLNAIDADSGINGEVFYTSNNEFLMIDKITGVMWLNPKIAKENENQWQVTVEASDKGSPSLTTTIKLVIDIIKQSDDILFLPNQIFLPESDEMIYLNSQNESKLFFHETCNVSSFADFLSNGEIYFYPINHQLFHKLSYNIFDFKHNSKHSQELTLYQEFSKNFQFACLPNILIHIPENSTPGSVFYTEIISNPDNQIARYKLLNEYETFMIDGSTGTLMLLKSLDAEIKNNFSLDVEIMNRNKQRIKCNVKILVDDFNDNLPIFEKPFYYIDIPSNKSGDFITVKAIDKDISLKHNQIIYSLNENGMQFKINQNSGVLSILLPLEANKLYNITVLAKNLDEKMYAHTSVLLKVLPDLNQKPVLLVPQEIVISELTTLGSVVASISALSESQTVTYNIIEGNLFSTFEIDPHTGQIILVRQLDFEKIQQFSLTIMAQTKTMNSTAVLNVKIENERDVIPFIKTENLTVQENQKPKTLVGRIEIEDEELRPISDLEFKILYQFPPNGRFYIDENNGIFTGDTLDREKIDKFRLLISIIDKKANQLKSEKFINVIVGDENDNMPECNDLSAFLIPKKAAFPLNFNINCNDKDAGYNASIGYKMVKTFNNLEMNWSGNLFINENIETSMLEVAFIVADRMLLETKDNADALRTSSNSKIVLIKENNDKLFSRRHSTFKIFQTSPISTVIGNLPTTKNTTRCYILQQTIQTNIFSISENLPQLLLIKSLPTNVKSFHFDIIGFDTVTHKTQIHKITIEIDENNPNGHFIVPVIAYEIFLNENISFEKPFEKLQVLGTSLTNLKFQFHNNSFAAATAKDFPFQINEKTGEIFAKGEIDYEKEHFYQSEVIISSKVQAITVPIFFHIIDINDNSPIFKQNPFNFFIREDANRNEFIGHIIASDSDNNGNDRLRYQLINAPSGLFILDTISGILTLGGELDHEKQAFYEFEVRAYDSGGLESKGIVFVFIEDVNDNKLEFDDGEIKVSIPEDVPVGSLVYTFTWDDLDAVNSFNFEIDPSTLYQEDFRIDNSGKLYVNNVLDREKVTEYQLKIILKDSFYPFIVHEARKIIKIILEDVNDNPPYFAKNYTFVVNEASEIGKVIGNVVASDPDIDPTGLNSLLQYRIDPFSNSQGTFIIDPLFGYIILNKKLDYEIKSFYQLTIIAMDNENPKLISKTEITIIVTDDDDNEPKLLTSIEEIHFDEDIPIGTLVTKIEFDDKDEGSNAEVIFDVVNGNGWFRINSFTGHIFVNRKLDFETQENFTLNISMVSFSGKYDATFAIVNIFLNDKNDESPIFVVGNQKQLKIAENIDASYPLFIYQFKAIDKDANSTTKYNILSGNSTLFSIDSNTGDLFINSPLDYETEKSHQIILKATDVSNSFLFSQITVEIIVEDVNDNAPVFSQPYYMLEIPENFYTNKTLLTIHASDADSNENAEIYYTIENYETVPFIIDYLNGELKATKVFDYEEKTDYTLIIRATDNGKFVQNSKNVQIRIKIKDENDNSPIFSNSNQDIFIKPNSRKGSIIFVVEAFDYDYDDEIILTLNGIDEKYFTIDKRGVIRVKSALPKQKREYSVTVIAKDSSNSTTSLSLTFYLAVEDLFPIFQMNETRFFIAEDKINQFITKVSADGNKCIRYSIASGNAFNNFMLDSFKGELIANSLDYEKSQEHHLYIAATNCQSSLYTTYQTIIISVKDVNDNKPIFEKSFYELKIMENSEPSKDPIVHVVASDADKHDHVIYQIVNGNYNNAFEIDSTNGKVYQLLELDREEHETYELMIEASDNGNPALKEICIVKVTVLDENDNAPRFSRLLKTSVLENAKIGDFVTQIFTYDPDTKSNAKNFYSIEGEDAQYFAIDPISGNITVAQTFDSEKQKMHKIKVFAQDKIWRVSASMTIFVEDVNDNVPKFLSTSYNFSILTPHTKNGYFVGKVEANDLDEGINKKFTYYTYSSHLYIDPESGEIFLTRNLSFLPADFITAEIFANDYGVPSNVGNTKVNIYLLDNYFESPVFEQNEYVYAIETPIEGNVSFGSVKTKTPNDRILYELTEQNGIISIDSVTGKLSGNFSSLQTDDFIEFTIMAHDYKSNTPGITTIIIKAVEKEELEFKLKKHAFIVYENTPFNSTVGYVTVVNPYVSFKILSTNGSFFELEKNTGRLFIAKPIDADIVPRLKAVELNVEVSFNGYPLKSKTTIVTIQIIDKNDNPPIFHETQKILNFTNTIPTGAAITVIKATDIDEIPFNEIFYSLSKQNLFDIDSKSGKIFAINDIDFSLSNQYSFEVIASNFNSTTASTMSIIIQLRIPFQNTAVFIRNNETFEISRRSIISSIIGQLEAHSVFGKNQYLLKPNDHFIIDKKRSGNLILNKKFENSEIFTVKAIVKSGILNRRAPDICQIKIITNELAPPPVFPENNYIVKLSQNAEPLTEVLRFNFILPTDVQMEIEGKGREAFCFDKRGVLMVCKKLQLKKYNLIMFILSNGRIRSKANIEIRVNEKHNLLKSETLVSYVPENIESLIHLLKLPTVTNNHSTKYWITDKFMNEFFYLNSSTGILSTKKSFDREKRSLYTIPISATSGNDITNISVNVFIDDEDDNEISNEKLEVIISSPKPLFTGIIPWIYPVDVDEVFVPACESNEIVPNHMIEITSNCSLIANETPMGKSTFKATFAKNLTYTIETNFLLNNDEITQNSIIIEMYGSRRAIADFMQKLQASVPDMAVHYLGANFYNNHTCQLFITVLSQSGIVLPPAETLRILDNFISKKSKVLDIINYRSIISLCDNFICGTQTCQQSKYITKEWETFRSINKLWTMPKMHGTIKCENKMLGIMNKKEQICGENKCFNGICAENSVCVCDANYYGNTCESKVYTFGKNSLLKYEPISPVTHLTLHLLTKEPHGLLLFTQSKTSNVTFIVDFFNGKLRMLSTTDKKQTSVVLQDTINDSHWHKIIIAFQQTGTISIVIENCEGDECLPCQKTNCFGIIPSILIDSTVFFGGLGNENLNLIESAQISSASLKACLKIVEINKTPLIKFEEQNMLSNCPLLSANNYCDSNEAKMSCQDGGTCISEWEDYKCFCKDGFESPSCNMDDYTVSLNNAQIRLELSPFIRQELIFSHFKNSKVEYSNNNFLEQEIKNLSTLIPCDSIEDTASESDEYLKDRLDGNAIQWLEIDIRTGDLFANIFTMKYGRQQASLRLINGTLHYGVYYLNKLVVEIIAEKFISDTKWHRIGIEVSLDGKLIRLIINGINKEVESAIAFPRMIFRGLDYIDFGSNGNESFHGCLSRLIINNQIQLLYPKMRSLSRQYFIASLLTNQNTLHKGCESEFICDNSVVTNFACSGISMDAKTRFTIFAGIFVIVISIIVLTIFALIYFYRIRQKQNLNKNSQRVSNLQLVSSTGSSSTYKNYSYDEFIASVLAKNRQSFMANVNQAYSDGSIDNLHIYDDAITTTTDLEQFTPVHISAKPSVMPRRNLPTKTKNDKVENEVTNLKKNPYKSRFFRPSEEYGLVSSGYALPISLNDFPINQKEIETGH